MEQYRPDAAAASPEISHSPLQRCHALCESFFLPARPFWISGLMAKPLGGFVLARMHQKWTPEPRTAGGPTGAKINQSVAISIRIDPACDDFPTAEFLTADFADTADKGRSISNYPRHLRYLRLNALAGSLVAALSRAARNAG